MPDGSKRRRRMERVDNPVDMASRAKGGQIMWRRRCLVVAALALGGSGAGALLSLPAKAAVYCLPLPGSTERVCAGGHTEPDGSSAGLAAFVGSPAGNDTTGVVLFCLNESGKDSLSVTEAVLGNQISQSLPPVGAKACPNFGP